MDMLEAVLGRLLQVVHLLSVTLEEVTMFLTELVARLLPFIIPSAVLLRPFPITHGGVLREWQTLSRTKELMHVTLLKTLLQNLTVIDVSSTNLKY